MTITWDGPNIFATVIGVSSIGAAAACALGNAKVLLPSDTFDFNAISSSLLSIQCFAIGVFLISSVYNNYAKSQLKFHALGLIPIIVLALSYGFMANVIQNTSIVAICVFLGVFNAKDMEHDVKWNVPTILVACNVVLLLLFCATPFLLSPGELFPQFDGLVSTQSFQFAIGSAFVYVLPMAAAVANNRASQLQPWWAACLFFNATTHMLMDPIDYQNAITNGFLGVIHISSAYLYNAKTTSKSE